MASVKRDIASRREMRLIVRLSVAARTCGFVWKHGENECFKVRVVLERKGFSVYSLRLKADRRRLTSIASV